jgi:hypothetical protein
MDFAQEPAFKRQASGAAINSYSGSYLNTHTKLESGEKYTAPSSAVSQNLSTRKKSIKTNN